MSSPNLNNLLIIGGLLAYFSIIFAGFDTATVRFNVVLVMCKVIYHIFALHCLILTERLLLCHLKFNHGLWFPWKDFNAQLALYCLLLFFKNKCMASLKIRVAVKVNFFCLAVSIKGKYLVSRSRILTGIWIYVQQNVACTQDFHLEDS